MDALSYASAELPLRADLFGVRHGGRGALWRGAWWVDGDDEDFAVPSFCEGWIRSGHAPGDAWEVWAALRAAGQNLKPRRAQRNREGREEKLGHLSVVGRRHRDCAECKTVLKRRERSAEKDRRGRGEKGQILNREGR